MTSSLKRRSLSKPVGGDKIHQYDLALVRGRNKNKIHSFLLEAFQDSGLTKAEVAQMLGKRPEQVTRWLAGPGNLTLETVSDLIFATRGEFLDLKSKDELARATSNRRFSEWICMETEGRWRTVESKASVPLGEIEPEVSAPKSKRATYKMEMRGEKPYERIKTGTAEGISVT